AAQRRDRVRDGGTVVQLQVDVRGAGVLAQHREQPYCHLHIRDATTMSTQRLTHLDSDGRATMVDVGDKPETDRVATARARVRMSPATAALVSAGDAPKGDVIGTARLAAIQAAKRTDEWIPLAHTLPLSG